ncbi:hypothetical protein QF117_19930 [Vibrio sp. YMD68]|uniref:hypothetical protein n=1 Tax=Vibrio sp. YMD68 TaxID=3042300 RepID=UPI00249A81B4|nr:hypothetical protein [Vibrio sp. YMD68]WGW00127.1 hypothetical protein QF117_19930 [Vibrio sp. YMD68]
MYKRISDIFSKCNRKPDINTRSQTEYQLQLIARDITTIKFMVTGLYLWLLTEHLLFPLMEAFGTNPY